MVEPEVVRQIRLLHEARWGAKSIALATVRFETAPGEQMQIDFGEKWVDIAGEPVRVFLLVAVLSHCTRCTNPISQAARR
jgi:hypothetical protein